MVIRNDRIEAVRSRLEMKGRKKVESSVPKAQGNVLQAVNSVPKAQGNRTVSEVWRGWLKRNGHGSVRRTRVSSGDCHHSMRYEKEGGM